MKSIKFFLSLYILVVSIYSTPTWMWVGTYGIDDYAGNGGGGNLSQSIAGANEFMDAAEVTFAAVSNNSTREMCDFIYFDGHGTKTTIFTGFNAGYGFVTPANLNMGTSYNRWAYFYTCLTLHWDGVFNEWTAGFSGVQTVLGFASLTWAVSYKENIHNQFWNDWVNNDVSMISAHFDACEDWLWNYGGLDVGPAMMTSESGAANSYDETSSASGVSPDWWEQRICGDPDYQ